MYAILRAAKLGSGGEVGGSSQHATRERETPNADPDRRVDNRVVYGAADPAREIEKRISELKSQGVKIRKDAVRAIELFISASPEFFSKFPEKKEAFYAQSLTWLQQHFGKENLVSVIAHEDESTPHLSVHVIPVDRTPKPVIPGKRQRGGDVRLNAHRWMGDGAKLSKMQTSYANAVKSLGLERGIEGSTATHQEVKRYYGILQRCKSLTGIEDDLAALQAVINNQSNELSQLKQQEKDIERIMNQIRRQNAEAGSQILKAEAELKKKKEQKISLGGQNLSLDLTIKTVKTEVTDKIKELDQLYDKLESLNDISVNNKAVLSKMENEKTEIEKQIESALDEINKIKIKSSEARQQINSEFNSKLVRKGDVVEGRCTEGFEIKGTYYAHIVTRDGDRFMPWNKEHYSKVVGKDIYLRKDMEGKIQDLKVVSIVQTMQTKPPVQQNNGPKFGGM